MAFRNRARNFLRPPNFVYSHAFFVSHQSVPREALRRPSILHNVFVDAAGTDGAHLQFLKDLFNRKTVSPLSRAAKRPHQIGPNAYDLRITHKKPETSSRGHGFRRRFNLVDFTLSACFFL